MILRELHPQSQTPADSSTPQNCYAAGVGIHEVRWGGRLESQLRVWCHQSSPRKVAGLILREVSRSKHIYSNFKMIKACHPPEDRVPQLQFQNVGGRCRRIVGLRSAWDTQCEPILKTKTYKPTQLHIQLDKEKK